MFEKEASPQAFGAGRGGRGKNLADYIQAEGPFDFSFSREGLRGHSRPRSIQEAKQ
jgi:hypothetical protein